MGHDLSQDAEIWDDAYKLDRAHVFHSWHAQRNLDPTEVVTGHGVWLKYGDGREMLDFTSQQVNVNIGYQHPKVIEGIKKQAELLCTVGPDYANLARGRAASLVARRAPEGFDKVFFTNAGADANENAMRAARLFTGRDKILSSYRCYHGNTGAAISATGDWRRKPNDYFKGVREITKKYSILMITDEVMAGFGRTGFWFALDDYDYTPDIISFAKGCNSGYVPAGGVIMSDPVAHRFDDIVFPGGLTYSGHPLAMGAIVATQEAMEEEHIVDNAYTIGKDVLGPQLTALYDKHPKIGEVRGKGVFWAVEMVADRTTKEPLDDATMKQIVAEGDKRGLILGVHNNRIHVTPPCVISADEATQGVEILDQVLTAAGC